MDLYKSSLGRFVVGNGGADVIAQPLIAEKFSQVALRSVHVRALATNNVTVYVGDSGVSRGRRLPAGGRRGGRDSGGRPQQGLRGRDAERQLLAERHPGDDSDGRHLYAHARRRHDGPDRRQCHGGCRPGRLAPGGRDRRGKLHRERQRGRTVPSLSPGALAGQDIELMDGGGIGVNEEQTISVSGVAGDQLVLSLGAASTAPLPYNATAAQIETALAARPAWRGQRVGHRLGPLGLHLLHERRGPNGRLRAERATVGRPGRERHGRHLHADQRRQDNRCDRLRRHFGGRAGRPVGGRHQCFGDGEHPGGWSPSPATGRWP